MVAPNYPSKDELLESFYLAYVGGNQKEFRNLVKAYAKEI